MYSAAHDSTVKANPTAIIEMAIERGSLSNVTVLGEKRGEQIEAFLSSSRSALASYNPANRNTIPSLSLFELPGRTGIGRWDCLLASAEWRRFILNCGEKPELRGESFEPSMHSKAS